MPLYGGCYIPGVRTAFFLLLLLLSTADFAACVEPPVPVFPRPEADNTSLKMMEVAQRRMQRYINSTEDYLECLGVEERKQKMDSVLATMKRVTSEYNALTAAYRKQKAQRLFSKEPG